MFFGSGGVEGTCDELDGAQSSGGEFTNVGEDARHHFGGTCAFACARIFGCCEGHGRILPLLDRLVGQDWGGGNTCEGIVNTAAPGSTLRNELLAREVEGLGQLGGGSGVNHTDVDPELGTREFCDAVNLFMYTTEQIKRGSTRALYYLYLSILPKEKERWHNKYKVQ